MLFENDYRFNGKYATLLKKYARDKAASSSPDSNQVWLLADGNGKMVPCSLFPTLIFGLIFTAGLGFFYSRKIEEKGDKSDSVNTLSSTWKTSAERARPLYRLMILSDKTLNLSSDERIRKAFLDCPVEDETKELEYFLSYSKGGLQILEEKLGKLTSIESVNNAIQEFVVGNADSLNVLQDN